MSTPARKIEFNGMVFGVSEPILLITRQMVTSALVSEYKVNAPPEAREPPRFFVVSLELNKIGQQAVASKLSDGAAEDYFAECGDHLFWVGRLQKNLESLHFQFDDSNEQATEFANLYSDKVDRK